MKVKNKIGQLLGSGGAGFLFLANVLVNVGNYALNIYLARYLGPEGFSEANILATLVMVLSFMALGIQLIVAKYVVTEDEESTISWIKDKVKKGAGLICVIVLLLSWLMMRFFNFHSVWPLVLLFLGIPSYFLMSFSRGYFQGNCDFKKLANTYIVEMLIRVFSTVILLFLLVDYGLSSEIVAIGFLVSFIVPAILYRVNTNAYEGITEKFKSQIVRVFFLFSVYELSQILINHSDIFIVKHFFDAQQAGLYSSIALLGKAIFFGTWIIVTILFPRVIEAKKEGKPHQHLFYSAMLLVGFVGILFIGGSWLCSDLLVTTVFGSSYEVVASILWLYALSTTVYALAHIFVYYYMSLENYIPIYISLFFGCSQILALWLFHNTFIEIISVQILLMSIMLSSMFLYHNRKYFISVFPNLNYKYSFPSTYKNR